MVNCGAVGGSQEAASSGKDCVVEYLLETEQVEDSHVDCAEKDAKVFGGGWSRVGQLQGKEIVGSNRVVIFSDWPTMGLTCWNRRPVARTWTDV